MTCALLELLCRAHRMVIFFAVAAQTVYLRASQPEGGLAINEEQYAKQDPG